MNWFLRRDRRAKRISGDTMRARRNARGRLGAIPDFTWVRHFAPVRHAPSSARINAPNGYLLGVLEKFAEKRASDQPGCQAAQVELDMYPRDLRQHRRWVGITREFSAQNAGQQPARQAHVFDHDVPPPLLSPGGPVKMRGVTTHPILR